MALMSTALNDAESSNNGYRAESQGVDVPHYWKFTWRIEDFSKLSPDIGHYSDIFLAGGCGWKLLIYPNGDDEENVALSIFLMCLDLAKLPYALFSFAVVDQIHYKHKVKKGAEMQLSTEHDHWGFATLIPLSVLYDLDRGYILNDTCIIEAEVAVHWAMDSFTCQCKKAKMDPLVVLVPKHKRTRRRNRLCCSAAPTLFPRETFLAVTPQLGELAHLPDYPGASNLFEDGQCQGILDEKFENIGGFSILKTQASLYRLIWLKYGHIASSQVVTSSYSAQVTLVTEIMNSVMDMHQCRLADVSSAMIELWETKIKMAENLEFNIRWLRDCFEDVKKEFYGKEKLKTELQQQDQSLRAAKARLILAKEELRKAQEDICYLENINNPLLLKKQMYLEKDNHLLFHGLFTRV